MCTYDYLPFVSCHSKNTKLGIYNGEVFRLMRTNLFQESFEAEVEFTFRKLIDRGYDRDALRKIRNDIPWSQKAVRTPAVVGKKYASRIYSLKISFSDAVRKLGIGGIIAKAVDDLPAGFTSTYRIVLCHVPNTNLFRLRYHRSS